MTRSLDILSSLRKWKPVLGSHSSSHGLAHTDYISSTAWIKVALKHSSSSTLVGSLFAPADACVHGRVWQQLPSSYLGTWPDISKVNGCRHRSAVTRVFLENSLYKDLRPVLLFLFCCCDLHYWFFFLYRKIYCCTSGPILVICVQLKKEKALTCTKDLSLILKKHQHAQSRCAGQEC